MRLWIPKTQRILFSQTFHSLPYVLGSGGYISGTVSVDRGLDLSGGGWVRYTSRGAGAFQRLRWWSVCVDVDVPAAGSTRSVFCCGSNATGVCVDLGIDSTNHMRAGGTAYKTSDDVITAGRHKLLYVFNGSNVEFWCDGVRVGTSDTFTMGAGSPFVFMGVVSNGATQKWGSTIYSVDVYTYPLDEAEAFIVSSVAGWTPRSLLTDYGGTYDDGFYWDGDEDGAFTLNTQPSIVNPNMLGDWGWTKGSGWSLSHGLATHAPGVAGSLYQVAAIVGNRYEGTWRMERCDGGVATFTSGANGPNRSAPGVYVDEVTSSNVIIGIGSGSTFDGDIRYLHARNLSATHLNPYGSGTFAAGRFQQGTNAAMPWQNTQGKGAQFDGSADHVTANTPSSVWRYLNKPNTPAYTAFLCDHNSIASGSTYRGLCRTWTIYSLAYVGIGIAVRRDTGAIGFFICGGGAGNESLVSAPGAFPMSQPNVVEVWKDASNGVQVSVNGSTAVSQTATKFVDIDPSEPLTLGATAESAGEFWDGSTRKMFTCAGGLTSGERTMVRSYLMRAAS